MPILDIKHVTTYRYNRPVSFGEHRMMLLPRDDDDQKVLECEIDIRPKPVRGKSTDLHEFLVSMTQTIKRTIEHVSRHEEGIQDPVQTLALKSGSCRDVAVLMIAAVRSRGIAARFVSGYVHLVDDDEDKVVKEDDIAGGNTHAWVQVYVPGPGWVDFDPAAGVIGNQNLIRVAAVQHPGEANPLQGTWYGPPSDHLSMNVAVRVRAVG